MPSQISGETLSQAVFQSVKDGSYPDDEQVIAAELPSSALESLAKLLEQARNEVKASIRELSKLSAPDIDGWVSQARKLRSDIEDSQKLAEEITTEAEHREKLRVQTDDASAKVHLLKDEVAFNENLASTLQQIQDLRHTLDVGQDFQQTDRLADAVSSLKEAEGQLSSLHGCENTRLAGLMRARVTDFREVLGARLTELWNTLICVDPKASTISINQETLGNLSIDGEVVFTALDDLDLLKNKIVAFRKAFDTVILTPRLNPQPDGTVGTITVNAQEIAISGYRRESSTAQLFSDVRKIIDFLDTQLPASVAMPLSEILIPSLISRLVAGPLSNSVPSDLNGISTFQATLQEGRDFAKSLDSHGWHGSEELMRWVNDAPRMWLTKRSDAGLHTIRQLLVRGLGEPREVERVETQVVSREDTMFTDSGNDDWNAGWSDNEDIKQERPSSKHTREVNGKHEEDEDDVSAWDLEDNTAQPATEDQDDMTASSKDDDGADAWGWGDENENLVSPASPPPASKTQEATRGDGGVPGKTPAQKEVTLKEMYSITALPEQILEIIIQAVSDAETLRRAESSNPISPAATGLYSLPGVLVSMYRACAPNFYTRDISGNMFLYNDSLYMAEQLRDFAEHQKSRPTGGTLDIEQDVSALEIFGKRAYGKEMELQRTILGDLLDGAQGFANCTEHPFAQECDLAISSTVDRLRGVYQQWKGVLSHSALLQSIGSLVSTVINKIIVDVEDMSDISEPESQRLTAYCNQIATLEDLFQPEKPVDSAPDAEQPLPLTAVYTPNWLKFQYLSNILESSLVDIKYLWTEGELALEFSAEELTDLIEALFADSEHRRKAIGEIRRSARSR